MKHGKNLDIKEKIESYGIILEHRDNLKFRINKTDIIISANFKDNYDEYKKINNLIIITKEKERKEILKMSEKLKPIDIIYEDMKNYEYIGERIVRLIS